jgi:hypothetical protein
MHKVRDTVKDRKTTGKKKGLDMRAEEQNLLQALH